MNKPFVAIALFVYLPAAWAQTATLAGIVTDPSGAPIPGAAVQLRGARDRSTRTDVSGRYTFRSLPAGDYELRVAAKGFREARVKPVDVAGHPLLDVQLEIQPGRQVVNVDGQGRSLSPEPGSNGGAVILGRRQLAALSDDPDELAMQLQALAGPAPGPNGGQMFLDGFSGGSLPPKSAIREVRINSNPFAPEYDSPGFARVEIFTKPGSEALRGQAFAQINDGLFNSRNPLLLTEPPPYRTRFTGVSLSGPLRRNRAAFTLAMERRAIEESSMIMATALDGRLQPLRIDETLPRPQTRTSLGPRFDYAINRANTLAARYQELRLSLDGLGAGDFNLPSRAYDQAEVQRTLQVTETAAAGPLTVNETRLQWQRSYSRSVPRSDAPAINVTGAFNGGGSAVGRSSAETIAWEFANLTIRTRGTHTVKWGGRLRRSRITDISRANFNGVFTFYSLEQYRGALSGSGGPAQFALNAGADTASVAQMDVALFAGDDWRVHPNLTLSLGFRGEAQSNLRTGAGWAPRFGVAWSLDGRGGRPARTLLRAGAGAFLERVPAGITLNSQRFNGTNQQSFLILNPGFFPEVPSSAALAGMGESRQLQPVFAGLAAPRLYQTSLGIERQINSVSRVTVTWVTSRGVHLLNRRNVNAPVAGLYPFGDRSVRLLTESAGLSRQNQIIANTNGTYRGVFLFGFYSLSYGKNNNEGLPADPYDVSAEWGPSSYGDMRHRVALGATFRLPGKLSIAPFLAANTGQPYNITTGNDPNLTGFAAERPALLPCTSGAVCFDSNPAAGTPRIGRNFGRGPGAVNLALRISRTWNFGSAQASPVSPAGDGDMHAGPASEQGRYSLTVSASTMNALNHANYTSPVGNLSSPYFGQYRGLGGFVILAHDGAPGTYNRKIDLQVRVTF